MRKIDLYTDGSYDKATGKCTGAFVIIENNKLLKSAQVEVTSKGLKQSWNVSGELISAIVALNVASGYVEHEKANIVVHHDYIGISKYVSGTERWHAKKTVALFYTSAFEDFTKCFPNIEVTFEKVKAHSGNYWNDVVDSLAKGRPVAACAGKMMPLITI